MKINIKEYKTIRTATPEDLEEQVNTAIAEQWRPFGGVAVAFNPRPQTIIDNILFMQALVK